MSEVPEEFDPFDQVSKADQQVTAKIDSRSYGKEVTVIEGFSDDVDLDELSSKLKSKLAAGGTVKEGHIEIQGNHLHRIEDVLFEEGFTDVEVRN